MCTQSNFFSFRRTIRHFGCYHFFPMGSFSVWLCGRVICKCDACGGKEKPMRPSEWERHTGCRKKKWKESIRVKNLEQPLVSWVSCLASSFVSNFILAIVLWFYIWKGLSFLVFSTLVMQKESNSRVLYIWNVNYSFSLADCDAASANVGSWCNWSCLWRTRCSCTCQATRAGSAISSRWWDQEFQPWTFRMFFNLSNFFGHLQVIDVADLMVKKLDVSVFMQVYVY